MRGRIAILIASATLLASVSVPTGGTAVVQDRGHIVAAGKWRADDSIVAVVGEGALGAPLIPCPPGACPPLGTVVRYTADGLLWRAAITCLQVDGDEAFMGLNVVEGDLLVDAAAYVSATRVAKHLPRFNLLRGVAFGCFDHGTRTALRNFAQPFEGVVAVFDECRVFVCPD